MLRSLPSFQYAKLGVSFERAMHPMPMNAGLSYIRMQTRYAPISAATTT